MRNGAPYRRPFVELVAESAEAMIEVKQKKKKKKKSQTLTLSFDWAKSRIENKTTFQCILVNAEETHWCSLVDCPRGYDAATSFSEDEQRRHRARHAPTTRPTCSCGVRAAWSRETIKKKKKKKNIVLPPIAWIKALLMSSHSCATDRTSTDRKTLGKKKLKQKNVKNKECEEFWAMKLSGTLHCTYQHRMRQ